MPVLDPGLLVSCHLVTAADMVGTAQQHDVAGCTLERGELEGIRHRHTKAMHSLPKIIQCCSCKHTSCLNQLPRVKTPHTCSSDSHNPPTALLQVSSRATKVIPKHTSKYTSQEPRIRMVTLHSRFWAGCECVSSGLWPDLTWTQHHTRPTRLCCPGRVRLVSSTHSPF